MLAKPPINPSDDMQVLRRTKWLTITLPTLVLLVLLVVTVKVLSEFLSDSVAIAVSFTVASIGIVLFSRAVFGVVERLQSHLHEQNRDLERRTDQLQAVNEAGQRIASDLSLNVVLQCVADSSRQLLKASYAAVAVVEGGKIVDLLVSGEEDGDDADDDDEIDYDTRGHGELAKLVGEARTYHTRDVGSDGSELGFPFDHPSVTSFLGVPIVSTDTHIGHLFVTNKEGGDFTPADETDLKTLALQAAIAIDNARMYDQVKAVGVLQERERIGMDLHDGAIQALYGVGLRLDACLPAVEGEVREDIDQAIEDLNAIIRNIRSYIFNLRLEPSETRSFRESLQQLLFDLSVNTLISAELVIDDEHLDEDPTRDLAQRQRDELFRIAQEALTNVRKHSHAKNVRAKVTAGDGEVRLKIVDDGVGITDEKDGEGLARMRDLARGLGGSCRVYRGRDRGTVVTVTVPMELDGEAA